MKRPASDVAFTATIKALQQRHGSRAAYERLEQRDGWQTTVSLELSAFIAERDSLYFATASVQGQPYVQHRGGPKGFLKVLDEKTLAFPDLRGNRQYITVGNLLENPLAFIFLMDYEHRRRVKLWGTAKAVEDYGKFIAQLELPPGKSPDRVIIFSLVAWNENCSQHIPRRFEEGHVTSVVGALRTRIAELERENARLQAVLGGLPSG